MIPTNTSAAMSEPSKADMLSMIDVCASTTNEGIRFGAGVALSFAVEALFASRTPAAAMSVALDVDWLSNVIRRVDGNHALGAGALAEKIVEALAAAPAAPVSADVRETALEEAARAADFAATWAKGEAGDASNSLAVQQEYRIQQKKSEDIAADIRARKSHPAPVTQQAAPVASEDELRTALKNALDLMLQEGVSDCYQYEEGRAILAKTTGSTT